MSSQDRYPVGVQQRLDDLADNVRRDLELLKQYEDAFALEDDPRRKERQRRAIDDLRQSASGYQAEYEALLARSVLDEFDVDRAFIEPVVARLDITELTNLRAILAALDADALPPAEVETALATAQQALASQSAKELEPATALLSRPTADLKQKLKITVPIIPFVLSYEGELGLSNSLGLRAMWQRLVSLVHARR